MEGKKEESNREIGLKTKSSQSGTAELYPLLAMQEACWHRQLSTKTAPLAMKNLLRLSSSFAHLLYACMARDHQCIVFFCLLIR